MPTRIMRSLALLALVAAACAPQATVPPVFTVAPPNTAAPPKPTGEGGPITATETPTRIPTQSSQPTSVPATPTQFGPQGEPIGKLSAGTAITVLTLSMLNETTGWATAEHGGAEHGGDLDDRVLRTSDGGATWRDRTPPQPIDPALPIGQGATLFALDANNVWVTYYDRAGGPLAASAFVWRTSNGGETWAASRPLDLTDVELYLPSDITFVDAQTGWLMAHVGAGMSHDYVVIFRTTDGGQSWTRLVDPFNNALQQSCGKTGMIFTDAQTGWVTGDCNAVVTGAPPYLYRTTDGGQSWAEVQLPSPDTQKELFANQDVGCGTQSPAHFAEKAGVIVVTCYDLPAGTQSAFVYSTADGGASWRAEPLTGVYQAADFISAEVGWVLTAKDPNSDGPRDLYATQNAAETLSATKQLNWVGKFSFVSPQLGWAVAESAEGVALVKTTDAGRSWTEIKPVVGE
jgi:photosystem II stability/assembly factor-like uncharacterized protein